MEFSKEKPPIYERCVEKFGVNWNKGIIFTFGDTIHCKYKISEQKIAHEKVHIKQQADFGSPLAWWGRYLIDVDFRLSQEVEAYQSEVIWINENIRDIKLKQSAIDRVIADLSGPIYGNIISKQEARNLIYQIKQ